MGGFTFTFRFEVAIAPVRLELSLAPAVEHLVRQYFEKVIAQGDRMEIKTDELLSTVEAFGKLITTGLAQLAGDLQNIANKESLGLKVAADVETATARLKTIMAAFSTGVAALDTTADEISGVPNETVPPVVVPPVVEPPVVEPPVVDPPVVVPPVEEPAAGGTGTSEFNGDGPVGDPPVEPVQS